MKRLIFLMLSWKCYGVGSFRIFALTENDSLMKPALLFIVFCAAVHAADLQPIPVNPPDTTLTEIQALKLENANLKVQVMNLQAQMADMNQTAVMDQVCKEVKFDDCQFNLRDRTVTQTPKLAPNTEPKPQSPGSPSSQPLPETSSTPQKDDLNKLDTKVLPKIGPSPNAAEKPKPKVK